MKSKIVIHLPNQKMRKFFDEKTAEMRYAFGGDVVYSTIWDYFNIKEDLKEEMEQENQHQHSS